MKFDIKMNMGISGDEIHLRWWYLSCEKQTISFNPENTLSRKRRIIDKPYCELISDIHDFFNDWFDYLPDSFLFYLRHLKRY